MRSVSGRIIAGSGAQGLSFVVRVAEQLLIIPVFLMVWSTELFGEWLVLSAIPIYLSLSDMGFAFAGNNELARRAEHGITSQVRNYFRDYVSIFLQWSLTIFSLAAVLVMWLPLAHIFNLTILTETQTTGTFLALVATALISQNGLTLIAGMRATKSFHIALTVRALVALLRLALLVVVLLAFKGGPLAAALTGLAVQTVEPIVLNSMLHRRGLPPGWRLLRKPQPEVWRLLRLGFGFMLMPIAQAVVLQGMVLLLGTTLGATSAAIYATHRTLTRITAQIAQLGINPLLNELGLQQSEEKRALVRSILLRATSLTLWASIFMAFCLTLIGKPLYETWTHGNILFHPLLFALLLGATLIEGMWRMASTFRLGSNQHGPLAKGYMVISLVGVGLAWLVMGELGLWSAGLMVCLIETAMLVLAVSLNTKLLDLSARDFLLGALRFPSRDLALIFQRLRQKVAR